MLVVSQTVQIVKKKTRLKPVCIDEDGMLLSVI